MSISRGSPPLDTGAPPRCVGTLAKCRIGDWRYPADVFEWWGRKDIQLYQPGAADPFDPAAFDPARETWRFERCHHPFTKSRRCQPLQVWKRIA
jgi:hypothetical protein